MSLCFLHAQDQPMSSMSYWDFHPLHAGGQIVRVGKADCEGRHPGNVHFRKSNAFVTMLIPFDAKNYIFPRIEFNYVTFDWNKNPKFREIHFYYLQFGLMFYSKALENWRWIVRFDYNIQTEHLSHPGQYSLYTGMLWGTYQIHRKWHYHVGALGYGGLEGGTVYPIIGFDYTANKQWFFQAIFPMIYSIEYKFRPQWTLAVKGRPMKERLRTGSREPQPRSIFNYSSFGAELNLNYNYKERLIMEIYGGYDFFGNFYIKNAGGHNGLYVDLNKAPYIGASLDFGI
jgi:hypothetical protein